MGASLPVKTMSALVNRWSPYYITILRYEMKTEEKLNMTMLCDFYELTMGNGYFKNGYKDRITYFDVFFRSVPDKGGFAIVAGLEQLIDYIENLHFTKEDIEYLSGAASSLTRTS